MASELVVLVVLEPGKMSDGVFSMTADLTITLGSASTKTVSETIVVVSIIDSDYDF